MIKKISILGSTGSIGTQALEVLRQYPNKFKVKALSSNRNAGLLIAQAKEFVPELVCICDEVAYKEVTEALKGLSIKVLFGDDGLFQVATLESVDMVLSAIVGFAGLKPTIEAIKSGKDIALANKETLVVAGNIVMSLARKHNVQILPVDSEHSAIFQSMVGEDYDAVRRLILTASGGPFRNTKLKDLHKVKCSDALKHPNWSMGDKITIDSATMMNKGLEVIEAHHIFKMPPFKIEILIHPQSIVHSMVEFKDGSLKAQLGLPDMRVPIQYAFTYPNRLKNKFPELDFMKYPELTFMKPDTEKFPSILVAFEAMQRGGNAPCSINAANEVAVEFFLKNKIRFTDIPHIVEATMEKVDFCVNPTLEHLVQTDAEARIIAREIISKL